MGQINRKRNYTTAKLDKEFARELKELAKLRYFKNLAKKEPSMAEITRLARRRPYWKNVLNDLRTKPKKEDKLI